MKTNKLGRIGTHFVSTCRKVPFTDEETFFSLDGILASLPHLSKKEGYVFEAFFPGTVGYGGETVPYAREAALPRADGYAICSHLDDGRTDTLPGHRSVLEALEVPFTAEGIWEALLVREMWRFLPLWWHANYERQELILNMDRLGKIAHLDEYLAPDGTVIPFPDGDQPYMYRNAGDIRRLLSFLEDDSLLPEVRLLGDDRAEVGWCYWSEWHGLVRMTLTAIRRNGSVEFHRNDSQVLVGYNCGILY